MAIVIEALVVFGVEVVRRIEIANTEKRTFVLTAFAKLAELWS